MSSALHHTTVESGEICVIALEGEIDLSNARSLREELLASLPERSLALVLDVSGLTYMDSRGISLLFELGRSLNARRRRLLLAVPETSHLNRLFEITELPRAVPIERTRDAAKARAAEMASDPLS